jgi:ribose-phosphate pyrophosphokinase
VPQRPVRFTRFANDCLEVQLQSNCRDRDVFLIQPLVPPVQENLVELLLMADAARGASAARVTAVMPHYAYARSDKKDEPRISIGGRLVADLLVTAGVNRVLTLALHSPQVHGFFSVPVDHLHALRELATHFRGRDLSHATVVSPDLGYAKSAAAFARRLSLPVWSTGQGRCCATARWRTRTRRSRHPASRAPGTGRWCTWRCLRSRQRWAQLPGRGITAG